jgi:hypothetical protein
MAAVRYFDMVREMRDAYNHRLCLVQFARQYGIKPAVRAFATTVTPQVREFIKVIRAECGGKLRIITGHGKNNPPRWGCPLNFNRGTCPNTLRERNDRLEPYLLAGLQESVLQPEAVQYALIKFQLELDLQLKAMSGQVDDVRVRKSKIEAELTRLAEAVAQQGPSPALMRAISSREIEMKELEGKLLGMGPGSVQTTIDEIRASDSGDPLQSVTF